MNYLHSSQFQLFEIENEKWKSRSQLIRCFIIKEGESYKIIGKDKNGIKIDYPISINGKFVTLSDDFQVLKDNGDHGFKFLNNQDATSFKSIIKMVFDIIKKGKKFPSIQKFLCEVIYYKTSNELQQKAIRVSIFEDQNGNFLAAKENENELFKLNLSNGIKYNKLNPKHFVFEDYGLMFNKLLESQNFEGIFTNIIERYQTSTSFSSEFVPSMPSVTVETTTNFSSSFTPNMPETERVNHSFGTNFTPNMPSVSIEIDTPTPNFSSNFTPSEPEIGESDHSTRFGTTFTPNLPSVSDDSDLIPPSQTIPNLPTVTIEVNLPTSDSNSGLIPPSQTIPIIENFSTNFTPNLPSVTIETNIPTSDSNSGLIPPSQTIPTVGNFSTNFSPNLPSVEISSNKSSDLIPPSQTIFSSDMPNQSQESKRLIFEYDEKSFQEILCEDIKTEKFLGKGGFGQVHQVKWKHNIYASKELFLNLDQEQILEFKKEVSILTKLNHPQIVRFFGASVKTKYMILMEFCENGDLYHYLNNRQNNLSFERKLKLSYEICSGIHYLHTFVGIVHSDLKSLNILLDFQFSPKISDFGLSTVKNSLMGELKGSINWMSPELLNRTSNYSLESDIYAYGLIVWEIYTRRVPFYHQNTMVTMKMILSGQPIDIPNDVPQLIKKLIENCTQYSHKDRMSSLEIMNYYKDKIKIENINFKEEVATDEKIKEEWSTDNKTNAPMLSYLDSNSTANEYQRDEYEISLAKTARDVFVSFFEKEQFSQRDSEKCMSAKRNDLAMGMIFYLGLPNQGKKDFHRAYASFEEGYKKDVSLKYEDTHCCAYLLGLMNLNGESVEPNYKKALDYFKTALKIFKISLIKIGNVYQKMDNTDKALKYYNKALESGYTSVHFDIGKIYHEAKKIDEAIKNYEKVENTNKYATYNLAIIYKGINTGLNKFIQYLKKAIQMGYAPAYVELGTIFYEGKGVNKDINKGLELYEKAASFNVPECYNYLGNHYFEKNPVKAVQYYEKGISLNCKFCMGNLGLILKDGKGNVKKDYEKAHALMKNAAKLGNKFAVEHLKGFK